MADTQGREGAAGPDDRAGDNARPFGIVTSEAVPLEYADAGLGSRTAAIAIDAVLVGIVLTALSIGTGLGLELAGATGWVAVTVLLVLNLLILFGYPVVAEVTAGRSLGKAALGLRVVTVEGAPVGFRHAAIRSAFMLVDFFATLGIPAVVSAAVTRRSQRLGDLVAGTVVLRERQASGPARAVQFPLPPGTERYAATLRPELVPAGAYARVRAFLLRADELDPAARRRLARQIADPIARTMPAPPEGMDAETWLRVLAAVHRTRADRAPVGSAPVGPGTSAARAEPGAHPTGGRRDGAGPSPTRGHRGVDDF